MQRARVGWFLGVLGASVGAALFACSTFSGDAATDGDAATSDEASTNADVAAETPSMRDAGDAEAEAAPACVGVVFASDPHNCGSCGHDCLGGRCSNSVCAPVLVGSSAVDVKAIAVSTGHAYWLSEGTNQVVGCAIHDCDGGPPAVYTSMLQGPTALAVVGDDVAVAEGGAVSIVTSGGSKTTLGSGYPEVRGISSDGVKLVYFVAFDNDGTGEKVFSVDATALKAPTPILSPTDGTLKQMAFAGGEIFLHAATTPERYEVCDAPSCANHRQLLMGGTAPSTEVALAAAKDELFILRLLDGPLLGCKLPSCTSLTGLYTTATQAVSIAADDSDDVFISLGNQNKILRCTHAGCASAPTFATGTNPHALYVTKNALYWATAANSMFSPQVWRLAK